jgi:hypothetical protein
MTRLNADQPILPKLRLERSRAGVAFAMGAMLFLSACVTDGGASTPTASSPTPNTPAAQLAERNSQFNRITAQGCGAGVVLGALAGLLIGGDAKSAALGAGAGGAIGCAAGAGIASQNESRQAKEQSLDNRVQAANQAVTEYQSEVNLTQRIVDDEKQKIAKLKSDLAQKKASKSQMSRQLAQVDENIKIIKESLANNPKRIAAVEKDVADAKKVGLPTAELEEKERRLRVLQREQQAALDSLIKERGTVG